ncbi:MAG TPA: DUF4349 domain-containing protein [Accumulibacter sp.]|uniref:DUF4349 domain-containing protein n=1 Tax=Accumulibacter sp. TaxID=2053492 RepID=UPI00287A66A8|nr:DUF4349 domain-containing protein [Accumulibacter sp.]HNK16585.1 DUF4349 domain-containing protein [Nitrospira sp.]MDS4076994.1 DUF4349 domain-containing protein [Accumulibacter sp.]HMW18814.1 DUF4349 domain-containing protein [Accumulibacter sp.]HNC21296.1 DUF4349 domain-containing protein [Accumulibacter sp.]HND81392.1 DUF4349 domain-containing protein [Accumulibacter sp.]
MKRLLFCFLILTVAQGCAKKEESAAMSPAPAMTQAQEPARKVSSFLAYEHSLSVDTEEQKVAVVLEAAQSACREAADELCTVLESRVSSGRAVSASLKFRAKPNGIRKMIAALSKQVEVTNQSTTAEDLEAPIADAAKKLAMLKDYRSKLEALRGRASHDIDALIKVNRELAQVQSELEASEGTHAHLVQRVETEILNVFIRSVEHRAFWRPISLAIADFGGNLSQGISAAITGIAFLIPWAIVLAAVFWSGRKLWRRRKGPKASA